MTTAQDLHELHKAAAKLSAARDYAGVVNTLSAVPAEQLLQDLELCILKASALSYQLKHSAAKAILEAARPFFMRAHEPSFLRRWQNGYAIQLIYEGELVSASQLLEICLRDAEVAGHIRMVAEANNTAGIVASIKGEVDSANHFYSRSLLAWQQLGDRRGLGTCHYNLAVVLREWGRYEEATTHFFLGQEYLSEDGIPEEFSFMASERAMLFLALGDHSLAQQTAAAALERSESLNNCYLRSVAHKTCGAILMARGELSAAKQHLLNAERAADATPNKQLKAEIAEEFAILCLLEERMEQAERYRQYAEHLYLNIGATNHQNRLRERLHRCSARRLYSN